MLDAHGPAVTLTRSGARHPRMWADRDIWLPYIDILKMNLEEASSAWQQKSADVDETSPRLGADDLHELAEHCLDHGVGGGVRDARREGLRVVLQEPASGELVENTVGRIDVENVVDTTGAGDSFAAGLAFGYLEFRDHVLACQYGNAMGAQRCSGAELNVYLSRAETDKQILAHYGPRDGPSVTGTVTALPSRRTTPRTG